MQGYSLSLKPVDQKQQQLAVRVYPMCYTVRSRFGALVKGYKLAMNGINSNF